MERGSTGSGSGQSSTLGANFDPQQIVAWSRNAKPNDLIEVVTPILSRVSDYSSTDQKMFFDQLNKTPAISKLLQQYSHA